VRLIDRQIAALHGVTDQVFIVTNRPERYEALGLPSARDTRPGAGALGGILTALVHSPAPQTLVIACDLPFLTTAFLRHLADRGRDVDVAIPRSAGGYEPLCASYGRRCVDAIGRLIDAGRLAAVGVIDAGLSVREIGPEELAAFDPDGSLFTNVNTPRDHRRALDELNRRDK